MEHQETRATSIHGRLRHDILRGVFRPGEKLRIETLSDRYDVGATPVREALNRLSAEELVLLIDQRGFRVAEISLDDLAELTKTLCWISERGLREAIEHGDAAWEDEIVLAAHRLSRVPRQGTEGYSSFNPDWERLHRALHLAMLKACGSRWLLDFYALLVDRHDRYKYLSRAEATEPRDVDAEHRGIVAAVLERDAERAVALANEHIQRTADIITRSKIPHLTAPAVAASGQSRTHRSQHV
jgi:GntR family transcriptional regulator, carbon starvation induced regulator